jgi:hypothetical protein
VSQSLASYILVWIDESCEGQPGEACGVPLA